MADFYSGNNSGGMSFGDALKMSKGMPDNSFANYSSSFSTPSGFYDYKPGGLSFGDAVKAGENYDFGKDNKGFLDQFLNKKTKRQEQEEKETKSQDTRETARELGKAWQSGSLGENLHFLAQSGGNEQPMVIGGGPAQPGAGSRAVSGAMTGAQLGSFIPGVGTGVGAAIGAGAGLLGII
tara:strand:- start:2863 stop:3402 length:540 start_codon:yes stop_codon:yes gene_type:complete